MKTKIITQTNEYVVTTGRGLLDKLRELLPFAEDKKILIVTDDNVARHYLSKVQQAYPKAYVYMVEPGEKAKCFENAESICNTLAKRGFTRSDVVLALGGGVVGDLAGFVSSIYMRGIPYVQIPTSLLAGIDSSVGGKTAVNISYGKNLVGRVYPPSAVVFDLDTLKTLSKDFFLDGLGEMAKYAVLDKDVFTLMEQGDLEKDLEKIVDLCIQYKKKVVEEDENEKGLRRLLNLGHTVGHAIERERGLGAVTHGIAVAMGLRRVVKCCASHKMLPLSDRDRILALLDKLNLPQDDFVLEKLLPHFAVDKKTEDGVVRFVTVHGIGDCRIEKIPLTSVGEFLTREVLVKPVPLSGESSAISSKSYAHRILFAAALSNGETVVKGVQLSDDVKATLRCIESLGADVILSDDAIKVTGGKFSPSASFDCGESGSTLRFLLPIAATLGMDAEFIGYGKLPERPIEDLLDALKPCGVKAINDRLPWRLSGKLNADVVTVDGSLSSQYVTGLLLALSAMPEKKALRVTGKKVSASYIDVTLAVLRSFGVAWNKTEDGYEKEEGALRSPGEIIVEGDWSNAAFFLCGGVLGEKEVTVKNLRYPTEQGDAVIVDILRSFGAEIIIDGDAVTARAGRLKGTTVDINDCPDLAPILSVVAACAEGESVFLNVDRLKIKESDRLDSIIKMLKTSGISAETDGEKLTIIGKKPSTFSIDGMGDHRMVMSETILATVCGGKLSGTEAVKKSYPDFFADFSRLGGSYARI